MKYSVVMVYAILMALLVDGSVLLILTHRQPSLVAMFLGLAAAEYIYFLYDLHDRGTHNSGR